MPRGKAVCGELRQRVLQRHENGETVRAIATALALPKSTVHNIVKHYERTGNLAPRTSTGRPKLLTKRDLARLERYIKLNRHVNANDLLEWTRISLGKVVNRATIYRYVLRLKYRFYKSKKKPFISSINKRKRLSWARAHKSWTSAHWNRILWSDESIFKIVLGSNGTRVIRRREEANNPACYLRTVQKPASVCVWGCMSAAGVGPLHMVNGTVDAEKYVDILQQHLPVARRQLFFNRPFTFQQDNAKPHTARRTSAWFRQRRQRLLPWPANSPDLSPIENLWRFLKRKVVARRPTTTEMLRRILQEEWVKVPVEEVRKLVESMPRRVAAVIKLKGDATKW